MNPAGSRLLRTALSRPSPVASWLGLGLLTLVAWAVVASTVPVPRYSSSLSARLVASGAYRVVEAPVAGEATDVRLTAGALVDAGDVLVQLDVTRLVLEERTLGAELDAIGSGLDAIESQLTTVRALERALSSEMEDVEAEETARSLAATEAQERSRSDLQRTQSLHDQGVVSHARLADALSTARQREHDALAARRRIRSIAADRRVRLAEIAVRRTELERESRELLGAQARRAAELQRLRSDIERRTIRAPIAGRIASQGDVWPGSWLNAGEVVATVVSDGPLMIEAYFPASRDLGRIAVGQEASFRPSSLPWSGSSLVSARVEHVARDGADGRLRVSLAIASIAPRAPLLVHGLLGQVDVVTQRMTLLALLRDRMERATTLQPEAGPSSS